MIDPRIYRAAFAPVLVAVVMLMFSVGPIPQPVVAPETFAADFDGRRATRTAERIIELAPERTPGSAGDEATAELVAGRFGEIAAGQVSEQTIDVEDGESRNVILELPGTSSQSILLIAERDSRSARGAGAGAAATGLLLEMASELGRTRHEKTIVLLSAGAGSEGSLGVREFIGRFPTIDLVEATLVIAGPGAEEPARPHVLPWATEAQSSSSQLVESARLAVVEETGRRTGLGGFVGNLFRLAIPSGLGAEAVAISEGLDAVAISAAGEHRASEAADTGADLISEETMASFGNATMALLLALDGFEGSLSHGPTDHLVLAGNLIPGWALSILALSLLLPALITAADGFVRGARRAEPALRSLLWAGSRSLPFFAALAGGYLLALAGTAPSPRFPFVPSEFGLDWRAAIVALLTAAAFVSTVLAVSRAVAPPERADTAATSAGLVASLAVLGVWLVNPYLALLCAPLAHVWLLGVRPASTGNRTLLAAGVVLALVPPGAALLHLAIRLDLGAELPWDLVLMVTGGHIGVAAAALFCLLAGSVLALLDLSLRGVRDRPPPAGDRTDQAGPETRPISSLVRSG